MKRFTMIQKFAALAIVVSTMSAGAFATGTGSAYEAAMELPVTTITQDAITFLPVVLLLAVVLWGVRWLKSLFKASSK